MAGVSLTTRGPLRTPTRDHPSHAPQPPGPRSLEKVSHVVTVCSPNKQKFGAAGIERGASSGYRGGEIETWGLSVRHGAGRFSRNGGHHAIHRQKLL